MIIGGDIETDYIPEILSGAAELYFRLPRLAEFYRSFSRWDGADNQQYRIAMLPELEGVFSALFSRKPFHLIAVIIRTRKFEL